MGTAIAKAMVDAGHRVVLLDRDEDRLMSLAQSLGPQTTTLVADITDAESVRVLPAEMADQLAQSTLITIAATTW